MDQKTFDDLVREQFSECLYVLGVKDEEYAVKGDRLHNFKVAAELKGETPRQALIGMMVKHTVSVFDMGISTRIYSDKLWNEKITDSINYLLLLRAILSEEKDELTARKLQVRDEIETTKALHQTIIVSAGGAGGSAGTPTGFAIQPLIDWEKES